MCAPFPTSPTSSSSAPARPSRISKRLPTKSNVASATTASARTTATAIQRNEQEQKTREENLNREQRVNAQYLEIFNYVVRRLHTMLTALAADAGVKMFSDFPVSDAPFLGELDFVHTNKFVSSTNYIGLGTNSAWRFEISTTKPSPVVPLHYGLRLSSPALRIVSQGTTLVLHFFYLFFEGPWSKPQQKKMFPPRAPPFLITTGRGVSCRRR